MNEQLIVFTDLDATLLDHNSYSFEPAKPALARLELLNIPVVLNSSKTFPEMMKLRERMGNIHPFIIENGAAIVIPQGYFNNASEECINFSTPHVEIISLLDRLKNQGFKFKNFNSMTTAELADATSLNIEDAHMAKERFGSEPLIWLDEDEQLPWFEIEIEKAGLKLIKGGRFYHVIGFFDKGSAIEKLLKMYQMHMPEKTLISIGLGDSPNDLPMLNVVDIPILIRSARIEAMNHARPDLKPTELEGPAGWNESILKILEERIKSIA